MQTSQGPVRAAIDIGSNTIHIVVARSQPGNLEILVDEVEMVRIGASVNATGAISPQKQEEAGTIVSRYLELARQQRADPVLIVATEAIRKASNSTAFREFIKQKTGLEVLLISGDVEATLTFLGATYELYNEADAPAQIAVMDLGGGSTELVLARDQQISWRTSIPVGSGWLHDRYLPSDPPNYDELEVARTFLDTYFQGMELKSWPPSLVVTGGSANTLLMLVQQAFGMEAEQAYLTDDDLAHCEGLFLVLSADEVARRYGQPLDRARVLPAGTLILRAALARFGLNTMRVSPHGIREGALLAYERYGEYWLQKIEAQASTDIDQTFLMYGEQLLEDRLAKLLEWREAVLKHEDVEAVHRMRVASRRLRAVLDAYESCCEPKRFKRVYRRVKEITDVLGSARDADVMLLHIQEQLERARQPERAGLGWLGARIEIYRQERQEALEKYFKELDEKALKRQLLKCLKKGGLSNGQSQGH